MQFHDYINFRNRMARCSDSEQAREWAKRFKTPEEFRKDAIAMFEWSRSEGAGKIDGSSIPYCFWGLVVAEERWVKAERPFYNIWPVASELASSVRLDIPFSAIEPPFESIALRFAKGFEPHGVTTAMLWWLPEEAGFKGIWVLPAYDDLKLQDNLCFRYSDPDTLVEVWLEDMRSKKSNFNSVHEYLIRLTVFVGLLTHDCDFITPIVLSKDRQKYETSDEDNIRDAIERRAARRLGRGFDVGRLSPCIHNRPLVSILSVFKTGHFVAIKICPTGPSAALPRKEVWDGESAQDGIHRRDSYVALTGLVAAGDCPAAGRTPRDRLAAHPASELRFKTGQHARRGSAAAGIRSRVADPPQLLRPVSRHD